MNIYIFLSEGFIRDSSRKSLHSLQPAGSRLLDKIVCVRSREYPVIPFSTGNVNQTFCHAKVAVHAIPRGQLSRNKSALIPLLTMAFTTTMKDNLVNRPADPDSRHFHDVFPGIEESDKHPIVTKSKFSSSMKIEYWEKSCMLFLYLL